MNGIIEKLISRSFTDEQGEQFDVEKFAQLIVRECADMFNETDAVTGSFVKKVLKEHFGVER